MAVKELTLTMKNPLRNKIHVSRALSFHVCVFFVCFFVVVVFFDKKLIKNVIDIFYILFYILLFLFLSASALFNRHVTLNACDTRLDVTNYLQCY